MIVYMRYSDRQLLRGVHGRKLNVIQPLLMSDPKTSNPALFHPTAYCAYSSYNPQIRRELMSPESIAAESDLCYIICGRQDTHEIYMLCD